MEATTARPGDGRHDVIGGDTAAAEEASARFPERVADPAPLGLAGFALTTFLLSFFNAGLVSESGLPVVLGVALAYGGIAQLLAGMWEFRNNNAFGATAFTSYGAFWISFWAFEEFFAKDIKGADALGNALGLYLLGWAIFTAYMWIASFRVSVAVNLVFLALTVTYVLLGIGESANSTSLVHAGGYAGIVTAALAWYASFATVTNKTFGRVVMPVKHLN